MNIPEVQNSLIELRNGLKEVIQLHNKYNKLMNENRKKMNECEDRKKQITAEIKRLEHIIEYEDAFDSVCGIEGYDTLSQSEVEAITTGMDKTNYSTYSTPAKEIPRWIDLERLVKEVIELKKDYPDWILISVRKSFQCDTLPPINHYKFTYRIPQGHEVSFGGLEFVSNNG